MKKKIAIIGYGRFGRLAARHLKMHAAVCVADSNPKIRSERGVARVSIAEAARSGNIILAPPINKLPSVLRAIAPFVKAHALVMDVCSVKEWPIKWMKEILPKTVSILGTHPLFGPDTASRNIKGKQIVICPVRISASRLRHVITVMRRRQLVVHQISPREHDRLMASTLFLTQLVGRSTVSLIQAKPPFTTENARLLRSIAVTSCCDSLELFHDIHTYNRFARRIPGQLLRELERHIRSFGID